MKDYLKMADVFPVEIRTDDEIGSLICDEDGIILESFSGDKVADYALHAINSHDELVAEVGRLRGENEALMKCRMAARKLFNCTVASGGLVEISTRNKAALNEVENASDWLEAELKATAGFVMK